MIVFQLLLSLPKDTLLNYYSLDTIINKYIQSKKALYVANKYYLYKENDHEDNQCSCCNNKER